MVLHHTACKNYADALHILTDGTRDNPVSSHYLISKEDGHIAQLVDEKYKAWHAGVSNWLGQDNVNFNSIGIELDNNGEEIFTEELMQSVIWLC